MRKAHGLIESRGKRFVLVDYRRWAEKTTTNWCDAVAVACLTIYPISWDLTRSRGRISGLDRRRWSILILFAAGDI